jgi:hypothetical protein
LPHPHNPHSPAMHPNRRRHVHHHTRV